MADPTLKEDVVSAGPAQVHTPNMRVVAHDLEVVDRIQTKRRMARLPTMGSIGGSVGIPKPGAYSRRCNPQDFFDDYTEDNCECS